MLTSEMVNHIIVSLSGWGLGIAISIPFLLAIQRIAKRMPFATGGIASLVTLLPWRTLLVAVFEFFYFPVPLMIALHLTKSLTISMVAGQVASLAILIGPTVLSHQTSTSTRPSLLGLFRSLGVLSVAFTTTAVGIPMAGLGLEIWQSIGLLDYKAAAYSYLLTVDVALVFDILLGGLIMAILSPRGRTEAA